MKKFLSIAFVAAFLSSSAVYAAESRIENYVNKRLYIPNYPQGRSCVESLNVAVATSIVCAEFRRRSFRS